MYDIFISSPGIYYQEQWLPSVAPVRSGIWHPRGNVWCSKQDSCFWPCLQCRESCCVIQVQHLWSQKTKCVRQDIWCLRPPTAVLKRHHFSWSNFACVFPKKDAFYLVYLLVYKTNFKQWYLREPALICQKPMWALCKLLCRPTAKIAALVTE